MKDSLLRYLITSAFLIILLPEQGNSIKILKDLLKSIKKQIKKKIPTRNNEFDDSVVYAIPTPDGQGFILHGYGKPYDPHAYDKNVDIYQIPKMWNGQFTVPNFFHSEDGGGYDPYKEPERKVKGSDNRIGFRVAIPFLGDFQYLREIGPGRFTDNLGPGKFDYPGFKDKQKKHHHDHHPGYDAPYSHHGSPVDEYGAGHGSSYDHGHNPGHKDSYHGNAVDEGYSYSASNDAPVYHEKTDVELKEKEPDPLEGLRNYPWYTRRR